MRGRRSSVGYGLAAFLAALALLTLVALVLTSATLATKAMAEGTAQLEGGTAQPDAGVVAEPTPVPALDLARFAGTWYVIATIPDHFHEGCAAEATITYTLQPDRSLRVQNRCRAADDSIHLDEGLARVRQPGSLTSRLEVRYAPDWLTWMPLAWSEVRIIGLGEGYSHALVATPDRQHLWLLSRSPVLGEPDYRQLLGVARDQGFNLELLREIPQEGGSATSVEEGVPLPAP